MYIKTRIINSTKYGIFVYIYNEYLKKEKTIYTKFENVWDEKTRYNPMKTLL